jgi:hypothetical protein
MTKRCLATVAVVAALGRRWNIASALVANGAQQFTVRVVVDQIEGPRADELSPLPLGFLQRVEAFRGGFDAVSQEFAYRIGASASSDPELILAVTLLALVFKRTLIPNAKVSDLARFSFGPGFFASLITHECDCEHKFGRVTLQRIAHIVAGMGNINPNKFGTRTFDQAQGWRVHLSGIGPGLRMMYWTSAAGIEFANVGVKKELVIEPGGPGRECRLNLSAFA